MIGARYRPAQPKKGARVRRHSVNSRLVPLGWGLLVLVGLSLYEFFPPLTASVGVGVLAAFGGMVTARYARRLCIAGVQPLQLRFESTCCL